jgi:hypothetical protein
MKETKQSDAPDVKVPRPPAPGVDRGTRLLRIGMIALVVFGLQWRFAEPSDVAAHRERFATPWAMMALLPVLGLGAWAYEVTGRARLDFKADVIWGVLLATTVYLAITALTLLT